MIPYGQHWLDQGDIDSVVEVLKFGPITQGQKVNEFGAALARYSGSNRGIKWNRRFASGGESAWDWPW